MPAEPVRPDAATPSVSATSGEDVAEKEAVTVHALVTAPVVYVVLLREPPHPITELIS